MTIAEPEHPHPTSGLAAPAAPAAHAARAATSDRAAQTTARPRRKRLSATDRRASILTAATNVFAETGYHRGKVSDVAARLGVSEPVIFQNFGSKAALYAAVIDEAAEHMSAALKPEPNEPVTGLLARLLSPDHLDWLHTAHAPGVLFADAVSLVAEPEVAEAARRGVQKIAAALATLLTQGQQSGDVKPDLDPETGAWWLLTLLASHGFRTAVMPDRARLEAQLAELTLGTLKPPVTIGDS